MKRFFIVVFTLIVLGLFSGCGFIDSAFKYRDTTKQFGDQLLHKEFDKCIGLMAMDNPLAANANIDTLKAGLEDFRDRISRNFGDKLEYTFMSAQKRWSTNKSENTSPNTTEVLIQFDNKKEFGVFQLLFDDKSSKILNIKVLDIKESIPNMTTFWLFGLLAICIPIFNIYMIVRIKRSQYKTKWLKYLAIIVLNVPAITYKAIAGLSIGFLSFQILLGISFEKMGYLGSAWTFGIPIAGLYLLRQLYLGKDKPADTFPQDTLMIPGDAASTESTN